MITLSKWQCFRQVRRYIELSQFYRVIGDRRRAAGLLNSASFWRRRWTHDGGLLRGDDKLWG